MIKKLVKDFTIFVLDDDKMFSSMLMNLAKRNDFVFAIDRYKLSLTIFDDMENLDDAITYIKNNKPDLVLLDYFLAPLGCEGSIDVLREIILCCAEYTKIIIITGMCSEDVRFKLIDEAVVKMDMSIIQKPFSIAELLGTVKTTIKKKENV